MGELVINLKKLFIYSKDIVPIFGDANAYFFPLVLVILSFINYFDLY